MTHKETYFDLSYPIPKKSKERFNHPRMNFIQADSEGNLYDIGGSHEFRIKDNPDKKMRTSVIGSDIIKYYIRGEGPISYRYAGVKNLNRVLYECYKGRDLGNHHIRFKNYNCRDISKENLITCLDLDMVKYKKEFNNFIYRSAIEGIRRMRDQFIPEAFERKDMRLIEDFMIASLYPREIQKGIKKELKSRFD